MNYIEILKKEIAPALGCTEPVAVALAVAKSAEVLSRPVARIEIGVSRNILKNAMGVGIPGTSMVGLEIAAALACKAGHADYGLEVLRDVNDAAIAAARQMVEQGRVQVRMLESDEKLYIVAACLSEAGSRAETVIARYHQNIVSVSLDGKQIYSGGPQKCDSASAPQYGLTLRGIYEFIASADPAQLAFLQEAIDMNCQIAQEGLTGDYGISVGRRMYEADGGEHCPLSSYAAALAAAASDARMAGCTLPVMSTTGSGNQGITATLPVVAVARRLNAGEPELLRAVALSELVTIYIKEHIGQLSALCGCAIAASVGSACGITLLQGGGYEQMEYAVKNMIADVSGLICDGAKSSCALKIATAVGSALHCSLLALQGAVISEKDGIIDRSVEKTVDNLGRLANMGMAETDRVILDMMVCK